MKTEAEKRVHECQECPLSFNNKKSLSTHMRTHNGLKTHKCESYGKEFSQIGSLKRHEVKFHGIVKPNSNNKKRKNVPDPEAQDSAEEQSPPKRIKTKTCNMAFIKLQYMKDHEETHAAKTNSTPPASQIANQAKADTSSSSEEDNSKQKPYSCDTCRRAFRKKVALKKHLKSHAISR